MNTRKSSSGSGRPLPLHSIDSEINHLERVLRHAIARNVLEKTYWHGRIMHLNATPGLVPEQKRRIQNLLDVLDKSLP